MKISIEKINGKPTMLNDKESFDLTCGFGINKANSYLRTLNTGLEIKFENYKQYNELISQIKFQIYCNKNSMST